MSRTPTIKASITANEVRALRVDRAYCCDSPFQVFTCIHMELHQHTCSDMYILDAFKDAGRIVEELRKRGLFRKVVLIGTERVYNKNKSVNKRTLKSSLGTFGTYFDVREIVEGYIEKDAVYDEMYFSCNPDHRYVCTKYRATPASTKLRFHPTSKIIALPGYFSKKSRAAGPSRLPACRSRHLRRLLTAGLTGMPNRPPDSFPATKLTGLSICLSK